MDVINRRPIRVCQLPWGIGFGEAGRAEAALPALNITHLVAHSLRRLPKRDALHSRRDPLCLQCLLMEVLARSREVREQREHGQRSGGKKQHRDFQPVCSVKTIGLMFRSHSVRC